MITRIDGSVSTAGRTIAVSDVKRAYVSVFCEADSLYLLIDEGTDASAISTTNYTIKLTAGQFYEVPRHIVAHTIIAKPASSSTRAQVTVLAA